MEMANPLLYLFQIVNITKNAWLNTRANKLTKVSPTVRLSEGRMSFL